MKNLTIRRRIIASFAIILALMLVMATVSYTRLIRIEQQAQSLNVDSLPGLYVSHQILIERIADYSLMDETLLQKDPAMNQRLRATVLVFLSIDCPISNGYVPTLNCLAEQYAGQGVRFVGINSNSGHSLRQIQNHRREYAIAFPVLKRTICHGPACIQFSDRERRRLHRYKPHCHQGSLPQALFQCLVPFRTGMSLK